MISSVQNARVKALVQLQKKRKLREEQGVFIVEGIRMFREVPSSRLCKVYVTQKCLDQYPDDFAQYNNQLELVSEDVFAKISETKSPQGILCVVQRNTTTIADIMSCDHKLILVLESLQDPGNVGTIIRSSEAAGVTGIILTKDCVDIYQAKTIRSTMGSIFRVPCVYMEDMDHILAVMSAHNVCTYAAHLQGEKWHDEACYTKECAFLIGNEGNGLLESTAMRADEKIKIPMAGEVESLNAAIAATLLMFEAFRQRR